MGKGIETRIREEVLILALFLQNRNMGTKQGDNYVQLSHGLRRLNYARTPNENLRTAHNPSRPNSRSLQFAESVVLVI